MSVAAAEKPKERRRWKAWVILEHDESLHRISLEGPDESEPICKLIEMGWFAIAVDVIER